jgi:hypothetical protein
MGLDFLTVGMGCRHKCDGLLLAGESASVVEGVWGVGKKI